VPDSSAPNKKAEATLETMRKIFTVPESQHSTLHRLDREISENLTGFLRTRIVAGDIAPANLERDFQETRIPEDPMFVSAQVEFLLEKVVAQSVRTPTGTRGTVLNTVAACKGGHKDRRANRVHEVKAGSGGK
jgi:hypothetical protein